MKKQTVLFYGELPAQAIHGVSISNERVLRVLSEEYELLYLIDKSSFSGSFVSMLRFFYSVIQLVNMRLSDVHYMYVNAPTSFFGMIKIILMIKVSLFLSRKEVKVVAHLHRGDMKFFFNKSFKNAYICKVFCSQLYKLLVLSEGSKKELKALNLMAENKVRVLYNSVDVSGFKIPLEVCNFQGPIYSLCNYIKSKGIDRVVQVANRFPSKRFRFNGESSSAVYFNEVKSISEYNNCHWGGAISGEDKYKNIINSKVLIIPSYNEGMPLVILEAMALGRPVICYNIGYISEYIGSDYPGIVQEQSIDALEQKLEWLFALGRSDYEQLCQLSHDIFWSRFSPRISRESILLEWCS